MKSTLRTLSLACLLSLAFTSQAFAQDPTQPPSSQETVKEQFLDFDEWLIDGEIKKPDMTLLRGQKRTEFKRLVRLKRSFLPAVQDTTHNL